MASKEEDEHRSSYQCIPESRNIYRPLSPDSLDADIEPSSSENEDVGGSGGETPTNEQPFKELQDSTEKPAMSNKRRICLVGSLLLCVFTVFAFAFILPCHHKTCLKETKWPNWSKNFTGISPIALRDFDTNDSTSKRLVVGFTHHGSGFHILNHTCPGCHGGVIAVNGGNGDQVWASGTFGQLRNVVCDLTVKQQEQSSCIALEDQDKILRIDASNGYQHWTTNRPGSIKAFRTIRDIDDDGIDEVVVLHGSVDFSSGLSVLSGQTGEIIGTSLPVLKRRTQPGLNHEGILHIHRLATSQILLIGVKLDSQETGTLLAIRIDDLTLRLYNETITGQAWGHRIPDHDGFIQLLDTLVITEPLFADLNNDGVKDIVVCTRDAGLTVKAIDGKDTNELWSRKLTSTEIQRSVPSIVLLGNKIIDIAIMIHLTNQSTRIVVISGKNGLAQWMFTLKHPLTVPPVGVLHKSHIPRGLLLWLPQVKITQHLSKRDVGFVTDFKTRRFGGRVRRGTNDFLNQRNNETPLTNLLSMLKRRRKRTNEEINEKINKLIEEVSNDDDGGDEFVNSMLKLQKDSAQSDSYANDKSDDKTERNSAVTSKNTGDSSQASDDPHGKHGKYSTNKKTRHSYEHEKSSISLYHHLDDDDEEHDFQNDDDSQITDVTAIADFMADLTSNKERNANVINEYHPITEPNADVFTKHSPITERSNDLRPITKQSAEIHTKHRPITDGNPDVNKWHRPITERYDNVLGKERAVHTTFTKQSPDVITEDRPITKQSHEKQPVTDKKADSIAVVASGHVHERESKPDSYPITEGEDDVISEYLSITRKHDVISKKMMPKHRPIAERDIDTVSGNNPILDRKDDIISHYRPITEPHMEFTSGNSESKADDRSVTKNDVITKPHTKAENNVDDSFRKLPSDHRPIREREADVKSHHRPITDRDDDIMSFHRPITERQVTTDNLSDLRDLLLNLEDRLKRETVREVQPTTQTAKATAQHNLPTSYSSHTASSSTQAKFPEVQTMTPETQGAHPDDSITPSKKLAEQTARQEDKPLDCDLPDDKTNRAISAVLIYRDAKNQLQLMEIAREKVIYIAPEDFVNKFGEQPPISYACVPLVPMVTTRPIAADIDGDRRPDLVYVVNYVTFNQSTNTKKNHLMKLRKVDILDAINDKKKGIHTKLYKSEKKNYKRNENFDSPFLKLDSV